jgi:glucosamine-6-phosphate deaminase
MIEKFFGNIKVIIADNYEEMSAAAGDIIAAQIKTKAASVLGLATGGTPVGTYKHLVGLHKAGNLDFSAVYAFNLDEYYPIAKANDQSYDYFMKDNLFNHVNIKPENLDIPSGEAADANAECLRYEHAIKDAGGIDLQLLGLGLNGHIGFNEPTTSFPKITNYVELEQSTIDANARYFESADDVPKHAITMGIGTIFAAKSILMVINGEHKADIAKAVITGPIDPKVQGSILQLHSNVTIVLDKPAAKHLI